MDKNSVILGAGNYFWRVKRKSVTPKQFGFLLGHSRMFGITFMCVDDKEQIDRMYPNKKPFDFSKLVTVEA